MLVQRFPPADLFALVPALSADFDPVLRELDHPLDEDAYRRSRHPPRSACRNHLADLGARAHERSFGPAGSPCGTTWLQLLPRNTGRRLGRLRRGNHWDPQHTDLTRTAPALTALGVA